VRQEDKFADKEYDTENNNTVKMGNISAPAIQEDITAIQEDVSAIQARQEKKVRVKTMI
jgi:hypothetical protein